MFILSYVHFTKGLLGGGKMVAAMSEVGMFGLAVGLLELFREKIQADLGDIELQKIEAALVKFSVTALDAYRDLMNEVNLPEDMEEV